MSEALDALREATRNTPFENRLWLVGGCVRDDLLGLGGSPDLDLVLEGSSAEVAELLYRRGASSIPPVTYARFGTAMVHVQGVNVEVVTARRESYDPDSRKPDVEPATLEEDARRRDFTVNALFRNLHTGELWDPLGTGLDDLKTQTLRTPLDPIATFRDDPLRMLRAVRFRWKLGFQPAPGLFEAIRAEAPRLAIISFERIHDEFAKMLLQPNADRAMADLMDLGLLDLFAPEFRAMVGVEQGRFHHLDVWEHTLLVLRNAGSGDLLLSLACLLHDVGKPATRFVDEEGNTRFFGHESLGETMTREILRRLKFSNDDVDAVALLVKNHMRLGSAPKFSDSAARRLVRDLGEHLDRLMRLVEADAAGLRPGVRVLDLAPIQETVERVRHQTPASTLESPLSGGEIMAELGLEPGPEVGAWKQKLTEMVLDGTLAPNDKDAARSVLRAETRAQP